MEPKFCCHVHKSPPPVRTVSHINPVHALTPYFIKIHSNIIISHMFRFLKWCLPFRFSGQNFVCIYHLTKACHMFHPYLSSSLIWPPNNIWCTQRMELYIMQFSPSSCHFIPLGTTYFSQLVVKHSCTLPLLCDRLTVHIHTEQQVKLKFCVL
jgi:hypothetical protein